MIRSSRRREWSKDTTASSKRMGRKCWSTAAPIQTIFRKAFEAVGLPYYNPHSLRKTLALLGQTMCRTFEEEKAWSQNLGHEDIKTTRVSYGMLPVVRQGELIRDLWKPKGKQLRGGRNFEGHRSVAGQSDFAAMNTRQVSRATLALPRLKKERSPRPYLTKILALSSAILCFRKPSWLAFVVPTGCRQRKQETWHGQARQTYGMSKCFSWATDRGLVPEGHVNPAGRIERYREQGHERFLTNEELARVGDVLREGETIGLPYEVDEAKPTAKHAPKAGNRGVKLDPYAVAAIRLLILTGARFKEILDAKWEHVDFERGILFLPDSKTGRKPVYLSAAVLTILASLPRLEGNPHIIAGMKDGTPRADLKKPWAAVTKAANLTGLRIHDLRHSFASIGAGASLGLPIIGKLLGHRQAATTQRYAHLDADPIRRAAETMYP
jgi:integrase